MSNPIEAAREVGEFLSKHQIRYVIIGGLAVQIWGEPRLTNDADLTIASSLKAGVEPMVRMIIGRYPSRVEKPIEFARKTRMILIRTDDGINVDISLALPGYEDALFSRKVPIEIQPDRRIIVCSAEDLIIHKAVAGRPQDVRDIEGIVFRQGSKLDLVYVRSWLEQFSTLLADDRIGSRFEKAWEKFLRSS